MKINLTKIKWKNIILILLIILFIAQKIRISNYQDKIDANDNFITALQDSIHVTRIENDDLLYEKRTLQFQLDNKIEEVKFLNSNQKKLINTIDELNRKNTVITAALIDYQVIIDSLKSSRTVINTDNKTISFDDSTEYIDYDITVTNVEQYDSTKNTDLYFNFLKIPNIQYIDFHFNEDKAVSFSITNSNKYLKVNDIQSYVIPEIEKPVIKPNFWNKLKNNSNKLLIPALSIVTIIAILK